MPRSWQRFGTVLMFGTAAACAGAPAAPVAIGRNPVVDPEAGIAFEALGVPVEGAFVLRDLRDGRVTVVNPGLAAIRVRLPDVRPSTLAVLATAKDGDGVLRGEGGAEISQESALAWLVGVAESGRSRHAYTLLLQGRREDVDRLQAGSEATARRLLVRAGALPSEMAAD